MFFSLSTDMATPTLYCTHCSRRTLPMPKSGEHCSMHISQRTLRPIPSRSLDPFSFSSSHSGKIAKHASSYAFPTVRFAAVLTMQELINSTTTNRQSNAC